MQADLCNKQDKAVSADAGTTSETLIECSQIPFLGEHSLHTTDCHSPCNNGLEQIQVGYFYELNHKNLPRRSPIYLKSIRVVMVTEKTEYNVAVKFPSSSSLRTYFRRVSRNEKNQEKNQTVSTIPPKLDEQFVMGSKPAKDVLGRQILPSEFSKQKKLESFWLVEPLNKSNETAIPSSISSSMENMEKLAAGRCASSLKDTLSAALNGSGLMRWGVRRRVTFVGRHKETNSNPEPGVDDDDIDDDESPLMDNVIKSEDEDEANEEAEEGILEQESTERRMRTRKRTREISMDSRKKAKTTKQQEKKLKEKCRRKTKNKKVSTKASIRKNIISSAGSSIKRNIIAGARALIKKNTIAGAGVQRKEKLSYDRWSKVRYKTAEGKMLDILKETKAVFGKPILRRDLRIEARKHIGDTGLLDHLLKHMAGKVAPNGEDRFRRRHNSEGEMEYWLESADLVNVRKEAGVNDPYWTPPPGWQLGDNPSQDPICAKELKMLRDEMAELKRNVEELKSSMSCMTKEVIVAEEGLEVQGNVTHEEQPAALMSSSSDNLSPTEATVAVVSPLKGMYESLVKRKAMLEQQLIEISVSLNQMQEEVEKVTSMVVVEETTKSSVFVSMDEAAVEGTEATADKGEEEEKRRGSSLVVLKREVGDVFLSEDETEKAAKRQRLRSGFRICKPQGTFLWPNMVSGGGTTPGSASTVTAAGLVCSNNTLALSPHQNGRGGHQHPQVIVQIQEDLNMVPTPSSVNSSSSSAPHLQLITTSGGGGPRSPLMKPLAERRAVTVTVMVPDLNSAANDDATAYESEDNNNNNKNHVHGHGHVHHQHHGKGITNNCRKEFTGTTATTPTSSLSAHQAFVLPAASHQKQQLVWAREEQSEAATAAARSSTELAQYIR